MTLFFTVFLSLYAALNGYLAWRLSTLPWVQAVMPAKVAAAAILFLAALFPLSWLARRWPGLAHLFEIAGTTWLGVFLLLLTALVIVEVVTLGGWVLSSHAPALRQVAACVALALSVVALVQARRAPALIAHEVTLPGLPPERDGFKLAVVSDLHLGSMLGPDWLTPIVDQILAQKPDAVAIVGDLVDRDASAVEPMVPQLARLRAPAGVFAVIGNHEYYAGDRRSETVLEKAGYRVLRNQNVAVAPGLVIAGIDDLTVAGRGGQAALPLLEKALAQRPPGAVILLSHTPTAFAEAAGLGAGLMLSGHTHDGQIWPFRYLVMTRYPHTYGFRQFGTLQSFVTRGVGTWGPRMRLWARGEIVVLTLRSPGKP
ncbi:metallophosphoesterase [Nibricoccus sp. IMCC34717]|uniref:metallophosphoesterase n=1 Tax=Nibricoccus sp. IMCC34717 TaxID=3034021 RepID=UPI00384ACB28